MERLCRYLRDCVQAEAVDTLTYYNLQNKKWFLHRGGSESLIAGDADSVSFPRAVLRKMKETQQSVTYGWPTLVAPDTKNHLQVAPLFIVTAEVNIEEGRLFAGSEPEFNIGVTAGQLFDRSLYEEVKEIVGDGVPFGDAPSLVVLASRISKTLDLKMQSELNPETLDSPARNPTGNLQRGSSHCFGKPIHVRRVARERTRQSVTANRLGQHSRGLAARQTPLNYG